MREQQPELTEGQRRHLEVRVLSLLAEINDLLGSLPSDLTPRQWNLLQIELRALQGEVDTFAKALALDSKRSAREGRARMLAWAAAWAVNMLDCRPQALRSYGPLSADVERIAGPAVEHIAARLARIGQVAAGHVGPQDS